MPQRKKYNAPDGYVGVIERIKESDFQVLLAPQPSGSTGDKKPKFVPVGYLFNCKGRNYSDMLKEARVFAEAAIEDKRVFQASILDNFKTLCLNTRMEEDGRYKDELALEAIAHSINDFGKLFGWNNPTAFDTYFAWTVRDIASGVLRLNK